MSLSYDRTDGLLSIDAKLANVGQDNILASRIDPIAAVVPLPEVTSLNQLQLIPDGRLAGRKRIKHGQVGYERTYPYSKLRKSDYEATYDSYLRLLALNKDKTHVDWLQTELERGHRTNLEPVSFLKSLCSDYSCIAHLCKTINLKYI